MQIVFFDGLNMSFNRYFLLILNSKLQKSCYAPSVRNKKPLKNYSV